jgi:ABC-type glucose/galactose transport system permease subunit
MRTRLVVGVLMCVVGGVWFTQGIGVLEGSFMTGQGLWTVIGVILFGLGLRMIWRATRRRGIRPDQEVS